MYIFLLAIGRLLNILEILILIRVFLNIFQLNSNNPISKIINELTEPVIYPARYLLNKIGLNRGMLDFSPWVAIILMRLAYQLLIMVLT
ncbi:MAG: YggT family protein [Tissierellales bacterium]|nr:YggT family protein [Tissierellales bacterium]